MGNTQLFIYNTNMKKIISLMSVCVCLLCLKTTAQVKPGTLMIGTTVGTTAYTSANSDYGYDNGNTKTTGTNTYTFSLGPQVGVFVLKNMVVGGTFSYSLSTNHVSSSSLTASNSASGSSTNTTTSTVSLGPFVRYYFAGQFLKNWFYVQANGAAGTGTGSNSGNSYSTSSTATTSGSVSNIFNWNAGASMGMTHFFNSHVGMDVGLGYNYSHAHNYNVNNTITTNKNSGDVTPSANNYTLNTGTSGVTLAVGFHWYL
jgi:hypothetical protein